MPRSQFVPSIPPRWDIDLTWPALLFALDGTAPSAAAMLYPDVSLPVYRDDAGTAPRLWQTNDGGEVFRLGVTNLSANTHQAITLFPANVLLRALPAGVATPSHERVHIWSILARFVAPGTGSLRHGFGIHHVGGPGGTGIWGAAAFPASGAGIGLWMANADGNLRFVRKSFNVTGNPSENIAFAAPRALTAFTAYDFVIVAATPSGPASFQLWVDGLALSGFTRSWGVFGSGNPEPEAASFNRYALNLQCDGTAPAGSRLEVRSIRYRQGRYLPDGTELLGT